MNRIITYAYNIEDGMVISRVDHEIAHPVLDFVGMKPENNWEMRYNLEKFNINALHGQWHLYKWTKKIPTELKNRHREFWGFKPLKVEANRE